MIQRPLWPARVVASKEGHAKRFQGLKTKDEPLCMSACAAGDKLALGGTVAKPKAFSCWTRRHRRKAELPTDYHHHAQHRLSDTLPQNIQLTSLANKGDADAARQLFDAMPPRTVVSWNAIISSYAKSGRASDALDLVACMHRSGTRFNHTTFSFGLGLCTRLGTFGLGKQVHCLVLKSGSEDFELVGCALLNLYTSCFEIHDACWLFELLHRRNPLLWSLLLVGFVKCNQMSDAMDLFKRMPIRDVISWTALISGYAQSARECGKSLELFTQMRGSSEVLPNEFTYDVVIRVCARMEAFEYGAIIHACLIKSGFESDHLVCEALIDFYCNCDDVGDAKRVFDCMDEPCLSTSNGMIRSLVSKGRIKDAELVFNQMAERNTLSYNLMIKCYAQVGRIADSKCLFKEMPCRNIVSLNTMMSVCHQSGEFEEALKIFEHVRKEKNTVSWNSMISGYIQNGQPLEALKLYAMMHRSSVECSRSTFSALFSACAGIGALRQGKMLHAHLSKTPFESNVYVGTSLVDMYARCGSIADARTSFSHIVSPNVASWTALICGFAHHGLGVEAILEFGRMLKHRIDPNAVTFVGLLLACGRAGMVDGGMKFFYSMEQNYGLVPTLEHYTCVVDLLSRSGYLRDAEKFILDMRIKADSVVWGSLLSACWYWMELDVGERVAERMFSLDSKHISTYVVMSNIYARLGKWEQVVKVRTRLRELRVKKDPGCSWIEVKDTVHVFCVEDRNHPQSDQIYEASEELMSNMCSNFESDYALYNYHNYCA